MVTTNGIVDYSHNIQKLIDIIPVAAFIKRMKKSIYI